MKSRTSLKSLVPVLFGFFIMGFCDVVGISVTYAKEQFQWSETQAGFLPFMVFFWFLVLSVPAAMFMNKSGRKNTVLLSMAFTFAGMFIPFIRFSEFFCYLAFTLLGMGNTILQVSLNPLVSNVVDGKMLTSSLTAGQFIKAISAFLGPILASFCSLNFGSWEMLFPVYAGITLISTLWLYLTSIPKEEANIKPSSFMQTVGLLRDNKILLLFLGILCVVGLDVGMNTVTPKLLMERVGLAKEAAGYGTSWYFAARTAGTFCGAFLLARVSERMYFRINMLVALAAMIALIFSPSYFLIIAMVCVIAFASSSIFAVIYSLALRAKPEKANEISGLMITGVSGGAIFPLLMGIATDAVGNQNGSLIIIAVCILYLLYCASATQAYKQG